MKFHEKLRLLRKANNMTQAEFAASLGISRGNLANIELGHVSPTPLFINCVCLTYHVDKGWMTDEANEDLGALTPSAHTLCLIMEKYDRLNDDYKKFVESQIRQLLELQAKAGQ